MKKQESITYDTKCRKCGAIQSWHLTDKNPGNPFPTWHVLKSWAFEKSQYPIIDTCAGKCGDLAVQDFICVNVPSSFYS